MARSNTTDGVFKPCRWHALTAALALGVLVPCRLQSSSPQSLMAFASVPPPQGPKRVTQRPGNTMGAVPVLMYHRLGDKESHMVRSRENFRRDLARLYKLGFRPVTLKEYATNTMSLQPGASPVVITFDDSWPDQLRLLKDGSVDPHCFVGEWLSFNKTRPDFPVKATFFALKNGPFGQKGLGRRKIKMLQDWGSEIASHTISHVDLSKSTDQTIREEVGESVLWLESMGAKVTSFAPPYGAFPRSSHLKSGFNYKGRRFVFSAVAAAGAGPARSPQDRKFRPKLIPRIKAYEGSRGVHWWLDKAVAKKLDVYVQP